MTLRDFASKLGRNDTDEEPADGATGNETDGEQAATKPAQDVGRRSFLKTCGAVAGALGAGGLGLSGASETASASHWPYLTLGEDVGWRHLNYFSPNVRQGDALRNWARTSIVSTSDAGYHLTTSALSRYGAQRVDATAYAGMYFSPRGASGQTATFSFLIDWFRGNSQITRSGAGSVGNTVDLVVYDWDTNRTAARWRIFVHYYSMWDQPRDTFQQEYNMNAYLRPGGHYTAYVQTLSHANSTHSSGDMRAHQSPTLQAMAVTF